MTLATQEPVAPASTRLYQQVKEDSLWESLAHIPGPHRCLPSAGSAAPRGTDSVRGRLS